MKLAGLVGKLLVGWGFAGVILASITHDRDYPAATWVLAYLGLGLLIVGVVMWWHADAKPDPPDRDDRSGP